MAFSQDELHHIADSVCREIAQASKDDGQVVHTVLDKYEYDRLSESDKLFVLTHIRGIVMRSSVCVMCTR